MSVGAGFVEATPAQPKMETKTQISSPFIAQASAPAAAIAASAEVKQAVEVEEPAIPSKNNGAVAQAIAMSQEHMARSKTARQGQSKFLGDLPEPNSRCALAT